VEVTTRPLLSVAQAAERLNVNEKTVRRLIHSGRLPALKVGAAVRIDASTLDGWLSSNAITKERSDGDH
jgi:excisionase family DNA binding protein